MTCGADMIVHYVMTATELRRESENQELPLKMRIDALIDAMMLLIYAGKESETATDIVDAMLLEYFKRLTAIVLG